MYTHKKPTLNYIYGKSAAERIFDREVKETIIYDNCVLVKFEHGSPRFVSRKTFKEHFAAHRKEKASGIPVEFDLLTGHFRATSERNITQRYRVKLFPDHLHCSCADWDAQEQLGIKTPMCKHCYAVLEYMGLLDLKEYIEKDGMTFLDHLTQWERAHEDLRDYHNNALMPDPEPSWFAHNH